MFISEKEHLTSYWVTKTAQDLDEHLDSHLFILLGSNYLKYISLSSGKGWKERQNDVN